MQHGLRGASGNDTSSISSTGCKKRTPHTLCFMLSRSEVQTCPKPHVAQVRRRLIQGGAGYASVSETNASGESTEARRLWSCAFVPATCSTKNEMVLVVRMVLPLKEMVVKS